MSITVSVLIFFQKSKNYGDRACALESAHGATLIGAPVVYRRDGTWARTTNRRMALPLVG